jgi:hypothetical protein|tara:strand:- start:510 stop:758 length:249 start_codon:yes stop_codon:yes gene_type:complete
MDNAEKIAKAIVNDKKMFNHIKKSIAWRISDVILSEKLESISTIDNITQEVRMNLKDEVRAIILEELPNALDIWLAMSGEEE